MIIILIIQVVCLIGKLHPINVISIDDLNIGFQAKQPIKRATQATNSLNIELLLVIDSGTYNYFVNVYNTAAIDNIKLYSSQIVNGINQRFQYSLADDSDLMISVSLTNVLILNNPVYTKWTNQSLCGVPGYPTYGGKVPLLVNCTLLEFQNYMNTLAPTLSFNYDFAVAIFSPNIDLWSSDSSEPPIIRTAITQTVSIASICSGSRYLVIEYEGTNAIFGITHGLGSSLGSVNDGNGTGIGCPSNRNYIMTPSVGLYTNSTNLFYFSKCSINSFKKTLLTPDYQNVNPIRACLLNSPANKISAPYQFPGQSYSISQQCQLSNGINSTSVGCNSGSLQLNTCDTLSCLLRSPTGAIFCAFINGLGGLEGTPCRVASPLPGVSYVCYQSQCVNSASILNNIITSDPCEPNPCNNGGICTKNATVSGFICDCPSDVVYADLLCSVPVSLTQVVYFTTTTTTTTSTTSTKTKTTRTTTTTSTTTTITTTTTRTTTTTTRTSTTPKPTTIKITKTTTKKTTTTKTTTTTSTTTTTTITMTTIITTTIPARNNLNVEVLLVIDSGTYNYFVNMYGLEAAVDNIKLYSSQLVNGINLRFKYSLTNDPDLMISVSLSNVLILNNPAYTQWTNQSLCGVPGYPSYGGKVPLLNDCALSVFQNYMNSLARTLSFNYDMAIAVFSPNIDLWDTSASISANKRSSVTGTAFTGTICSNSRYSVLEYGGLNSIFSATREIGTILGASDDGTGAGLTCPTSENNIMTPLIGLFNNFTNLFYFSKCSIGSFKNKLLTFDYQNVNPKVACLLNSSTTAITSPYKFPGQSYSVNQQCQLVYGINSTSVGCNTGSNQYKTCSSLYCLISESTCLSVSGYGSLEGTPCRVPSPIPGFSYACYQSQCVNAAYISNNIITISDPCEPNPCNNGGICTNSASGFICNCPSDVVYADLLCSVPVSSLTV